VAVILASELLPHPGELFLGHELVESSEGRRQPLEAVPARQVDAAASTALVGIDGEGATEKGHPVRGGPWQSITMPRGVG
jgi:hypothetical protein